MLVAFRGPHIMVLSNFDPNKSILMPMCEQQRALYISVQYNLQNDLHREMMLNKI